MSDPDGEARARRDSLLRESERYRAAAEETLEQLGFCIAYLYRIGKPRIAGALARNRSEIRRRLT